MTRLAHAAILVAIAPAAAVGAGVVAGVTEGWRCYEAALCLVLTGRLPPGTWGDP